MRDPRPFLGTRVCVTARLPGTPEGWSAGGVQQRGLLVDILPPQPSGKGAGLRLLVREPAPRLVWVQYPPSRKRWLYRRSRTYRPLPMLHVCPTYAVVPRSWVTNLVPDD